ncbi:BLUF domain-containing protein [Polaribacter sp.]|nr:BLUF domain-containing protein [Polaribacter sp.]
MNTINSVDFLRNFSFKIDGEFIENENGGFLTFRNDWGKGSGKAFELFPGLEVITFNITSKKEIILGDFYRGENCLHFIFCTEGSLEHTFENQKKSQKINRLQNVIIGNSSQRSSKLTIAPESRLKLSIISIVEISSLSEELDNRSQLCKLLHGIITSTNNKKEYAYFGEISTSTEIHVETLIETSLSGLSNRLINEAAVLKTLSSQYTKYNKTLNDPERKNPLSKNETLKIIQLSEYISQHLTENISLKKMVTLSGMNQKKIQKGFHFFFDETVNKFIINLRILKAKELLETTSLSISEIVYKIGLNSRSYFSKIFYKKYGLIPKEYRKYHHLNNPTFQLSYSSESTKGISKKDLEAILDISRKNNKKLNITGCLIHRKNMFFQLLEGPKTEVLEIFKKITKDTRNQNATIVFEGIKSGRTFKEWNMALIEGNQSPLKDVHQFNVIPMDFIAMADIKNPIANKYMWEKARNFLIVNLETEL